jgi:uncharacterized membrane protein
VAIQLDSGTGILICICLGNAFVPGIISIWLLAESEMPVALAGLLATARNASNFAWRIVGMVFKVDRFGDSFVPGIISIRLLAESEMPVALAGLLATA